MTFFNQSTVLITGASSGLGMEFARQLAPQAGTLLLVARRKDRLEALKAELERPGLRVEIRVADLSDRCEVEALLPWLGQFPINVLINNAGLGDHGFFEKGDWERVRQMIEVNIEALTRLTHALLPSLRERPEGAAILNVSSVAALVPIPKMSVYAATKAYVSSFSEALRAELRGTGVRVTALCPGPVSTEFGAMAQRAVDPDPIPAPEIMKVSPERVVADALAAVAADRPRVIPGWFVAALMLLSAAMPLWILRLAMRQQVKN